MILQSYRKTWRCREVLSVWGTHMDWDLGESMDGEPLAGMLQSLPFRIHGKHG